MRSEERRWCTDDENAYPDKDDSDKNKEAQQCNA
jgi:hypothetical protein